MKRAILIVPIAFLFGCSKPQQPSTTATVSSQAQVDYSPRIGIAVQTASRSCVAIKNATLTADSPLTLIVPLSPQQIIQAKVTGRSSSACPITQDVDPSVNSYDISAVTPIPQKDLPMIAVVSQPSAFQMDNVLAITDLDQNGGRNSFSACGASDGVHLFAWKGNPNTGSPIWKGYYYEPGNPGTLPACAS